MKKNTHLPKITANKAASLPQRAAAINVQAAKRLQNKAQKGSK